MPNRTLDEKREQMIVFLLENIVSRTIERQGNDVIFIDGRGKQYFIKTLSRQADLTYNFEKDPRRFDNDRRRLRAICDEVASFIQEKNRKGFIPGFVFLQADTDYPQLKERTEYLVNRGHFLKQNLPSSTEPKPGFDNRVLDPLEFALLQFYRHNVENSDKRSLRRGRIYYPELVYFNPKKGVVEVVWFSDIANPLNFKFDHCPVCENLNVEKYNHEACRKDLAYEKYVLERRKARYSKLTRVSKTRRSIDSRCKTQAERSLRFKPAMVDDSKLYLPEKESYIAVVR